jgi:hypothetical protein
MFRRTRARSRARARSRSRSRSRSSSQLSLYDLKFSSNENYIIDVNNDDQIYINSSIIAPGFLKKIKTKRINRISYNLYKFNSFKIEFQNDCLKFAECVTLKEYYGYIFNYDYNNPTSFLKEKTSNKIFGDSDTKNTRISKEVKDNYNNNFVDPDIGESYAIVKHMIEKDKMPYHIAYVFGKDGNSNITIEGDAGNTNLNSPKFDIYDVKQRKGLGNINKTFYETYNSYFKPCTTMILTL